MSTKKIRKVYTAEFKAEALKLADKIGVLPPRKSLPPVDEKPSK